MVEHSENDWASGIAAPVLVLANEGASDDELLQFIRARRAGDSKTADEIVGVARDPRVTADATDLGSVLDEVLLRLRIEAIRPCVNGLDVRLLAAYIEHVVQLSESVLRASRNAPYWAVPVVISRVADVISKITLEHLAEIARARGINSVWSEA
jgi:hypothetical protein